LRFTIAAKYGYDTEKKKDRVEFISCILFKPSSALAELLTMQGKGTFVEFEGRISNSKYEKDGETKYSTDVIVNKSTFNIITSPCPLD